MVTTLVQVSESLTPVLLFYCCCVRILFQLDMSGKPPYLVSVILGQLLHLSVQLCAALDIQFNRPASETPGPQFLFKCLHICASLDPESLPLVLDYGMMLVFRFSRFYSLVE